MKLNYRSLFNVKFLEEIKYNVEFKNDFESISNYTVDTIEEFKETFDKYTFNLFKSFDFSNTVIAGGFILGCVKNFICETSDINIYFYNITENELNEKIKYITSHINNINSKYELIETKNSITFYFDKLYKPIQIILIKFNEKHDILDNFDIPICKILYDGNNILTSCDVIHDINYGKILLNNTCYIDSNETINRLKKYFRIGYKICMNEYSYDNLLIQDGSLFDYVINYKYYNTIEKYKLSMKINENENTKIIYNKNFRLENLSFLKINYYNNDKLKLIEMKNNDNSILNLFIKENQLITDDKYINSLNYLLSKPSDHCYDKNLAMEFCIKQEEITNTMYYGFYIVEKHAEYILTTKIKNLDSWIIKLYCLFPNNKKIIEKLESLLDVNNEKYLPFAFTKQNIYLHNNVKDNILMLEKDINTKSYIIIESGLFKEFIFGFGNEMSMIKMLYILLANKIFININELYNKILIFYNKILMFHNKMSMFYSKKINKKILEMFLEYYTMYNIYFKSYSIDFLDIDLIENNKFIDPIENSKFIDFYVNKNINIYNIHLLQIENIRIMINGNNFDKTFECLNLINPNYKDKVKKIYENENCSICFSYTKSTDVFTFQCQCNYIIHKQCKSQISKCLMCKK